MKKSCEFRLSIFGINFDIFDSTEANVIFFACSLDKLVKTKKSKNKYYEKLKVTLKIQVISRVTQQIREISKGVFWK